MIELIIFTILNIAMVLPVFYISTEYISYKIDEQLQCMANENVLEDHFIIDELRYKINNLEDRLLKLEKKKN